MTKQITTKVRPSKEPNHVAIAPCEKETLLVELERQGIVVGRLYYGTDVVKRFSVQESMAFRDELNAFSEREACIVLEAYGNADDLRKLAAEMYEPPEEDDAEEQEPTPCEKAIGEFDFFRMFRMYYNEYVEEGNERMAAQTARELAEMWPATLEKLERGISYCAAVGDIAGYECLCENKAYGEAIKADLFPEQG